MLNGARRVAGPNSGQKMSNLSNKITTKQLGALLVATDVLSTNKDIFLIEIGQKWPSYGPKRGPNFIAFGPLLGQISMFFNEEAKCGRFSAYFGRNFRPATHSTLWDGHKELWNIHTCYEATHNFRGLFFKIWADNRLSFLKMLGGPDGLGKFSYSGQID